MKTIVTAMLLLFGTYAASALAQKCSLPTGELNGQLDISQVTKRVLGSHVGATLKIVSVSPPAAEFIMQTQGGCSGRFPSVAGEGSCEGNVMKLVIDRSKASFNECRAPVSLHLRMENGKYFGRFGEHAINSGTDNLQF